VPVRGVSKDGKTVPSGALYIAIKGERFDGHDFIAQAESHGAAAAMVRRDWRGSATIPLLRVDDTRAALTALAVGYRRTFSGFVAGVTGSVGKTTTKSLIEAFFRSAGTAAATPGNLNNDLGLPLSLLAAPRDIQRGIFELGTNHPGEIAPLARALAPDAAVITAIGPVHLEHFNNIEAIANEKAELLRAVPAGGFVVLDAECPFFDLLRRQTRARVVSVSLISKDADYFGRVLDEWNGEVEITARNSGRTARVCTGLSGRHHAGNLLLAAAMACESGVPLESLSGALKAFHLPPMRWEKTRANGFLVINDAYNANAPSMLCALRTFAGLPDAGRRVVVLGDMLELGPGEENFHHEVGRAAAEGPWQALVCVGHRARWIADEAIAAGFPAGQVWRYDDAVSAAAATREWAQPGDAVLVKASRGIALERVARALLGETASTDRMVKS